MAGRGVTLTRIAEFLGEGITINTVSRHERLHRLKGQFALPTVRMIRDRADDVTQTGVMGVATHLLGFALEAMEAAARASRPQLALQAHTAGLKALELIVRISGSTDPAASVTDVERRAAQLQARVLAALTDLDPAARELVARRLMESAGEPEMAHAASD
jgi:hypothetical protein